MNASILVVEDEALVADDIQRILRRLGYDVPVVLASGEEALAAVEQHSFDLALMDITLQGQLDGIETACRLRDDMGLPTVFLTAHSDERTLARTRVAQPYGYLVKPFTERDLRTTIEVARNKAEFERKLAAQERWFATTIASLGDAVIAVDRDDRISFMNPVAERITGWTLAEATGQPLDAVFRLISRGGDPIASPAADAMDSRLTVELPRGARLVDKTGECRLVDDAATAIVDPRGELLGGVVVFRDITERRRLEDRLAQAERMAAIGTLAAGAAHEINNPLACVMMQAGLASETVAAMSALAKDVAAIPGHVTTGLGIAMRLETLASCVNEVMHASHRIRRIVADLRTFARTEMDATTTMDLGEVLASALAHANGRLHRGPGIELHADVSPRVRCNPYQLTKAFEHVLLNAADAVADLPAQERRVSIRIGLGDEGDARVEIEDSGAGIAPADLPRVFEPFFTTKPVGAGTGLGLSIAHGIVEAHGGTIVIESPPDRGACVRIRLPIADDSA